MKRRNLIASLAVLVALFCLGAVAAYFLLRPGQSPSPDVARAPEAGESSAPSATPPPSPEEKTAGAPAEEKKVDTPAPSDEKSASQPSATEDKAADAGSQPQSGSGDQPSFDIVRIEPTGEGVLAGRAVPGWKVIVESRGVKVAEASADDQGEWTVILDRPLSPGSHSLSLKATSPDGAQEFSSKQTVWADVAAPRPVGAAGPEVTASASPGDVAQTPTVQPTAGTVAMAPKPGVVAPRAAAPTTSATGVPAPQAAKPQTVPSGRVATPSGAAAQLPQTAAINEGKATPPSQLSQQDRPGTYTILPGDTLWDIAQRYLGAGWRYKAIYQDNRKIIRNPNLIYPEQKMAIPEPSGEPN